MTPHAFVKIWAALNQRAGDGTVSTNAEDFIRLMLLTHLSAEELRQLLWDQLSTDCRLLHCEGRPSLRLCETATAIFRARRRRMPRHNEALDWSPQVFEGNDQRGCIALPKRAWWRIREVAGEASIELRDINPFWLASRPPLKQSMSAVRLASFSRRSTAMAFTIAASGDPRFPLEISPVSPKSRTTTR